MDILNIQKLAEQGYSDLHIGSDNRVWATTQSEKLIELGILEQQNERRSLSDLIKKFEGFLVGLGCKYVTVNDSGKIWAFREDPEYHDGIWRAKTAPIYVDVIPENVIVSTDYFQLRDETIFTNLVAEDEIEVKLEGIDIQNDCRTLFDLIDKPKEFLADEGYLYITSDDHNEIWLHKCNPVFTVEGIWESEGQSDFIGYIPEDLELRKRLLPIRDKKY